MNQAYPQSNRYKALFTCLAEQKQAAFIPFVIIGDPNPELSLAIIKTMIDAGADALELGIPFSDPSADGITIQKAANRALAANVTTDSCLSILAEIRAYAPNIPIGLLLYGNLVFARGIENFYRDVANAGVDSVLIADLPIRESAPFRAAANLYGINAIFIAPPNASDATLQHIAEYSQGYTYVLSRAGVTGANDTQHHSAQVMLEKLKSYHAAPTIQGFGISAPEQVKAAIESGAHGAISGSATVNIIEQHLDNPPQLQIELAKFIKKMKAATIIS